MACHSNSNVKDLIDPLEIILTKA